MSKKTATLKNWKLDYYPDVFNNTYFIRGIIFDDKAKRFSDDKKVRTSKLLKIDFEKMQAETLNTIYNLSDMEG